MALVGVAEAAAALGISVQRVHQLIGAGVIAAERPGHEWLVDEEDLPRLRTQRAGRPLSAASAWALLLVAHDEEAARALLSPSERSRAKSRLRGLVAAHQEVLRDEHETAVGELRHHLHQLFGKRAGRRAFHAAPRDLADLRGDGRTRLSGVSLPAAGIAAADVVECYASEDDIDGLVDDYLLEPARPTRSNVVVHVAPEGLTSLAAAVPTDHPLLVAVDLNEHRGPRELSQAVRLLDCLDALARSGRLDRYGGPGRG